MKINVLNTPQQLGERAAALAAKRLEEAIAEKGSARLILSTGSSQFETLEALIQADIDWGKVEMFHLDEYVNLPESHPASFRKYLKERVTSRIPFRKAHFVSGEGDIAAHIQQLTDEIRRQPIDVALIGIGENAHIAFNDPPANFETKDAFIVVQLDERCKQQQVGEGWFATADDVPKEAITMTVHQIMLSKVIISCVPHIVKAEAVKATLENETTPLIPSTILKEHADWHLFLDEKSASKANPHTIEAHSN